MPAISRIRLTNVVYEGGDKRFNDDTFLFQGENSALLLENGGGKTVFIHTALQAILPHTDLGDRKIKETLQLTNAPAHIGIEWIINERPRRYMATVVTLFLNNNRLESYRYVYEYEAGDADALEHMPFVKETRQGERPAYKEDMLDYFSQMRNKTYQAQTFDTMRAFHAYIEKNYDIIKDEWESIVKINRDEGGIEKFFENCRTTGDLYDRLLIPTVEDSIAGHEQGMFADMFEKQREGFQTYRNLQKSMREYAAIQRELAHYVDQYKRYDAEQTAYDDVKRRAKGLFEAILTEKQATESELSSHGAAWDDWHEADKQLKIKAASYRLLQETEKVEAYEGNFREKNAAFAAVQERVAADEKFYYSLRHAQLVAELNEYKQLYKQYKGELAEHDADSDVADYEAELEVEHGKLHGYFLTQLDALEKVMREAESERRPLVEAKVDIENKIAEQEKLVRETDGVINRLQGELTSKMSQMDQLKQRLLANPAQDDVQTEYDKWIERHQFLDDDVIRLRQLKRTLEQNIDDLMGEQEEYQEQVSQLSMTLADKRRDEHEMQVAHDEVVEHLVRVRASWQTDDLHLKESSIYGALVDMSAKLRREREELMDQERRARRLVDDYGDQENFFSDAFLAGQVVSWREHFFVQMGPEFLADLPFIEQEKLQAYRLWPVTLVTTERDNDKLVDHLTDVKSRLQFPVHIVTLEQVKAMSEQGVPDEMVSWVTPDFWTANLNAEAFTTWKATLQETADVTITLREEKEANVAQVDHVVRLYEQFFKTYPKQYKDELRETMRDLESEREKVGRSIDDSEKAIKQTRRDLVQTEEQIAASENEKYGLEREIERAVEFFQIERDVGQLKKAEREYERERGKLEREKRSLKRLLEGYVADLSVLDDRMADQRREIAIIKANPLYDEVKKFRATYTDETMAVILERRDSLTRRIHGIQLTYDGLRTRYDQAQKDIDRVEKAIADHLYKYDDIDVQIVFPVDGEAQLERIWEQMRERKTEQARLSEEVNEANSTFISQQGRVKRLTEEFAETFSNEAVATFDMPVEEIADYLERERQALVERKTYLEAEKHRIEVALRQIEEAERELIKYEVAHQFNMTAVVAERLTEKELMNFSYEKMAFVEVVVSDLEEKQRILVEGKENIDSAKSAFRAFCRNHITERKLREMASEGIELKTTYADVLDFQQNMLVTVERADQYARNYIAEKDKEVQAFINSMHHHLMNVTDQLRAIPRNTRVRVGDKWREIFQFSIPEWEEEDGKTQIRNHLDWILEQLESATFKDEHGLEDSGKVRKQIEKWLHTKQLLQTVMDHDVMKVSCRKVTNDNQVTSRLTSWEQSNKWSGGEKWSKNMTLFLGILNFVAEKKRSLDKKMKRHRAVILDNPFGKASSDHVLNPVFFIAEQLGFQMIALTAHADGKFLQDYFPVNYSLKLRATADDTKQVMTKEKRVHVAYFEDHEPEALERLEEREQMELF